MKIRYDVEEALCFVLNPGSDSELSELESGDNDGDDIEKRFINRVIEELSEQGTYKLESTDILDTETKDESVLGENEGSQNESELDTEKTTNAQKKIHKKLNHVYRWRSREPPIVNSAFCGKPFSPPPENFDELTPLRFFQQFWDEDITHNLVEQTNLYSVQKTGTSVGTNREEMK